MKWPPCLTTAIFQYLMFSVHAMVLVCLQLATFLQCVWFVPSWTNGMSECKWITDHAIATKERGVPPLMPHAYQAFTAYTIQFGQGVTCASQGWKSWGHIFHFERLCAWSYTLPWTKNTCHGQNPIHQALQLHHSWLHWNFLHYVSRWINHGNQHDIFECTSFDPEAIGSDIQYTYIQRLAHIMRHFTTIYVSKILKESCLATCPNLIDSDW